MLFSTSELSVFLFELPFSLDGVANNAMAFYNRQQEVQTCSLTATSFISPFYSQPSGFYSRLEFR